MNQQCELCSKTASGETETTYYGFEVFVCHDCKDTDRYLDQIEGMTKCLCNNWFDQGALQHHLHNRGCTDALLTGDNRPTQTRIFTLKLEQTHAF